MVLKIKQVIAPPKKTNQGHIGTVSESLVAITIGDSLWCLVYEFCNIGGRQLEKTSMSVKVQILLDVYSTFQFLSHIKERESTLLLTLDLIC